jgi:Zn-dependent peptidase ImmA (M78 family)
MREGGIRDARRYARALLRRFGVRSHEHIRVEAFAAHLGVILTEAPLDGATAQLVRNGKHAHILVSTRPTDIGSRRFSIAHELGHFVLEHPSCAPTDLFAPARREPSASERDYEAEANAFAAELLMPSELVQHHCEMSPVDLEGARQIARQFSVSILASARRFAELSPERCAAVFAIKGDVSWSTPSLTFTHEIRRGRRLDAASLAFDFFARDKMYDHAQPVPADAWLETSAEIEIIEHSIGSREFRTTLSMLWVVQTQDIGNKRRPRHG